MDASNISTSPFCEHTLRSDNVWSHAAFKSKNFNDVVIVPSKAEYGVLLDILNKQGAETTKAQRRMFATRAFSVSSHYDTAIHAWFNK